jgi:type II secretory pathway pseudopilin PulG
MVAYTVPRMWSKVLQRDRDQQTLFVMKQYARSIIEYQKKHGGLPTSLDQLKQARSPRLVRGVNAEWVDPMTGKVDWILVPPTALSNPAITNITDPNPQNKNYPGPSATSGTTGTGGATGTTGTNAQGQPGKGPADYTGPFVGVRPNKSGKSYLIVHGSENYEDWVYTTQDLTNEINARVLGSAGQVGVVPPAGGPPGGGRVQPQPQPTPKP